VSQKNFLTAVTILILLMWLNQIIWIITQIQVTPIFWTIDNYK
jgi:hypothetical protein